ncbi:hypothetical protein [Vibrio echinoideorum]|uniref:Uncharacterized protein n=1 Tax=Vibrio echinoideorum TaxID=2100116 RepID=A0ABU9FXV4_9VIBR
MHKCEELANQTKKDNGSRGAVCGAIKVAAIGSAGVGGSRDRRKNQQNYEQEKRNSTEKLYV